MLIISFRPPWLVSLAGTKLVDCVGRHVCRSAQNDQAVLRTFKLAPTAKVVPVVASEELVFDVTEQALRACVVRAVALPRHALYYLGRAKPFTAARVLVPPARVAPHDQLRFSS